MQQVIKTVSNVISTSQKCSFNFFMSVLEMGSTCVMEFSLLFLFCSLRSPLKYCILPNVRDVVVFAIFAMIPKSQKLYVANSLFQEWPCTSTHTCKW